MIDNRTKMLLIYSIIFIFLFQPIGIICFGATISEIKEAEAKVEYLENLIWQHYDKREMKNAKLNNTGDKLVEHWIGNVPEGVTKEEREKVLLSQHVVTKTGNVRWWPKSHSISRQLDVSAQTAQVGLNFVNDGGYAFEIGLQTMLASDIASKNANTTWEYFKIHKQRKEFDIAKAELAALKAEGISSQTIFATTTTPENTSTKTSSSSSRSSALKNPFTWLLLGGAVYAVSSVDSGGDVQPSSSSSIGSISSDGGTGGTSSDGGTGGTSSDGSADDTSSGGDADDTSSGGGADDTSSGGGADDTSSGGGADDTSSGGGSTGGFSDVTVNSRSISITLYDDGKVDGDRIRLQIGGQTILSNHKLKGPPGKSWNVILSSGNNTVTVTALNEGSIPPNTAVLILSNVINGNSRQEYQIGQYQSAQLIVKAP